MATASSEHAVTNYLWASSRSFTDPSLNTEYIDSSSVFVIWQRRLILKQEWYLICNAWETVSAYAEWAWGFAITSDPFFCFQPHPLSEKRYVLPQISFKIVLVSKRMQWHAKFRSEMTTRLFQVTKKNWSPWLWQPCVKQPACRRRHHIAKLLSETPVCYDVES